LNMANRIIDININGKTYQFSENQNHDISYFVTDCILSLPDGITYIDGTGTVEVKAGLTGLFPNGKNADLTFNNLGLVLDNDVNYTLTGTTSGTLFLKMDGTLFFTSNVFTSDTPPTLTSAQQVAYWYNKNTNVTKLTENAGAYWQDEPLLKLCTIATTNGVITSFIPELPLDLKKNGGEPVDLATTGGNLILSLSGETSRNIELDAGAYRFIAKGAGGTSYNSNYKGGTGGYLAGVFWIPERDDGKKTTAYVKSGGVNGGGSGGLGGYVINQYVSGVYTGGGGSGGALVTGGNNCANSVIYFADNGAQPMQVGLYKSGAGGNSIKFEGTTTRVGGVNGGGGSGISINLPNKKMEFVAVGGGGSGSGGNGGAGGNNMNSSTGGGAAADNNGSFQLWKTM
jgi:hypothetical protein